MAPIPVRVRDAAARDAEYTALLARTDDELAALKRVKADGLLYYARGPRDEEPLVVPNDKELRTWLLVW
jgi:hypothetical protein